ncbi:MULTISPECIES: TfuA-like protein [Burkholderia]|uniref:TfuA-like core domain-containing protein n=1 Tax=Burkholderia savannae TaxID=1637837 RepID=A0ABR5TK82_9BURK|nr:MULTISPECIES: TfuA-like protein [Burkholderia]KGS07737.1 tfuA-like family protein [Burkholderia sp. ABCPW 111]KWZ40682.1 hypothetical protein WS73_25550 [Burkholderia savannae]KWZ44172.1 hypothetical protein WS72_15795 [Burkholderia savannae]
MICHVFVGPTAFGLPNRLLVRPDLVIHGPAARGDIRALGGTLSRGAAVALIDGRFGDVPSVAHWEILEMLDAGVRVFGLSSMGAIRAAELQRYGMTPYGSVAQRFVDDPDLPDDEVMMLHSPRPPYAPISEPLVHLREGARHLVAREILSDEQAARIIGDLRERWFGERTWETLIDSAAQQGIDRSALLRALGDPQRYRVKSRDLENFLHDEPWAS